MIYYNVLKIFLSLIHFSLLGSVSLRNAKDTTAPYDYEYIYGCKTRWSDVRYLYERENGKYYSGHNINANLWWLHFSDFNREAYSLNLQSFSIEPYKHIKSIKVGAGVGYMLQDWRNGTPVCVCGVNHKYLESKYKTNFNRRWNVNFELRGKPIKITIGDVEGIALTPKIVYHRDNEDKLFWQFKLFAEYFVKL